MQPCAPIVWAFIRQYAIVGLIDVVTTAKASFVEHDE
jgi:hypothetical protein